MGRFQYVAMEPGSGGGYPSSPAPSFSSAVGDSPLYPTTTDSTFAHRWNTDDPVVFVQQGLTPKAGANGPIPDGHGIATAQTFTLASGLSTNLAGIETTLVDVGGSYGNVAPVMDSGPMPSANTWFASGVQALNIPPDQVPAALARMRLEAYAYAVSGSPTQWFVSGLYVEFTTYVSLEVNLRATFSGPGEASEQHIGGTFLETHF